MGEALRIACFEDSLTEGYGLSADEALPAVLERMLREDGIDAECLNFGVSGDTTGDGLRRTSQVLDSSPDCVILEFGANDCFIGEAVPAIRANFDALIQAFQTKEIPILLVGITVLPELGLEYKTQFDPIFDELASTYGLPLFPDILASYYSNPLYKLMDDTHPNEQGVKAIARDLLPQVKELVQSVKS